MATLELLTEKCWRTDCTRRPVWIIRGKDGQEKARACGVDAKAALKAQNEKEAKS